MQFPLPNRDDLLQLHRDTYFRIGPAAADVLAELAAELVQAHADCEMWEQRAIELRSTHPQYINEDKGAAQRNSRRRYSQLRTEQE